MKADLFSKQWIQVKLQKKILDQVFKTLPLKTLILLQLCSLECKAGLCVHPSRVPNVHIKALPIIKRFSSHYIKTSFLSLSVDTPVTKATECSSPAYNGAQTVFTTIQETDVNTHERRLCSAKKELIKVFIMMRRNIKTVSTQQLLNTVKILIKYISSNVYQIGNKSNSF